MPKLLPRHYKFQWRLPLAWVLEVKADQLFIPLELRLKQLKTFTAKIEEDLYSLQYQNNPLRAAAAMRLSFDRFEKRVKAPSKELIQRRAFYCSLLQAAGDYAEEQRQIENFFNPCA